MANCEITDSIQYTYIRPLGYIPTYLNVPCSLHVDTVTVLVMHCCFCLGRKYSIMSLPIQVNNIYCVRSHMLIIPRSLILLAIASTAHVHVYKGCTDYLMDSHCAIS